MRASPADPAPVRLAVAGDAAGRRLDAVVGALEEVGSRAEAQRLIEAGRVVDGRAVPKRHLLAEGESVEVRPAPAPALGHRARGGAPHRAVRGRAPAGGGQARGGGRARAPVIAVARWCTASCARHRRRQRPGALRSSTVSTATPQACWSSPAPIAPTGACSGRFATGCSTAAIVALVHGAAPPALTIDRPVGRDRRVRTRMAVGAPDAREAVTHLRRSRTSALHPPGGPPRDRQDPSDPGAPGVGRAPRRRRPHLRPRPETLGLERQFTPPAWRSRTRRRARRSRSRARCPTTFAAPWRSRGGPAPPRREVPAR